MLRILTALTFLVILNVHSLGGSVLRNTKQIQELLGKSDLVIIGSLQTSKTIVRFSNSSLLTKDQAPVDMGSAIFTGTISSTKALINTQKTDIPRTLNVVWFDNIVPDKEYIDQLSASFCPPISHSAYSQHMRIWFIKYDHGIWKLVSDQPIDLTKHIEEFICTGIAKALDAEYKKWLETPNKDDPFSN